MHADRVVNHDIVMLDFMIWEQIATPCCYSMASKQMVVRFPSSKREKHVSKKMHSYQRLTMLFVILAHWVCLLFAFFSWLVLDGPGKALRISAIEQYLMFLRSQISLRTFKNNMDKIEPVPRTLHIATSWFLLVSEQIFEQSSGPAALIGKAGGLRDAGGGTPHFSVLGFASPKKPSPNDGLWIVGT